jgi:outer membrane receptor protein involved in Fe transport
VNVGADYTFGRFEVGLNVQNLLNKSYHQSGMSTGLIPQQGRWLMFEVGFKF